MKLTGHELPRTYWRKRAEENGVLRKTFDNRVARGWTDKEAATGPVDSRKGWKAAKGTDADVSRSYGLYSGAVTRYRRHHGDHKTPAAEIAERLMHKRAGGLNEMARRAGMNPKTVRDRVHRGGWPLEEALNTPPLPPGSTIMQNRKRAKE